MDSLSAASSNLMVSNQSNIGVLSGVAAVISSFVATISSILLNLSIKFQSIGETLLIAFLVLSFLQAVVALYQYRYDVRGQLIFPDGPTIGVEDFLTLGTTKGDESNILRGIGSNRGKDIDSETPKEKVEKEDIYGIQGFLQKLNKSLLLLLPWITGNLHNILTKNSHLFHIGFIITMVSCLGDTILKKDDGNFKQEEDTSSNVLPTLFDKLLHRPKNNDPIRILVIGDSLGVGIGCLEVFDPKKNNSWPMALVENIEPMPETTKLQSPVFPQILARTLSSQFNEPVHWRSGGVDGGDINDINKFCMDIIRQECASAGARIACNNTHYTSGPPDVVVVLFGMNDMKNLVSSNIIPQIFSRDSKHTGGITYLFRDGMETLIKNIRAYAPNTFIVFPQLPIQTFHKNSIVNILPLGMFVDAMMGYWERQKRRVMEGNSARRNTLYIDLHAKEIAEWYCPKEGFGLASECNSGIKSDILISADGVHPNKKMYARWSETVGKKFYERIKLQLDLLSATN
eukprot:scaffold37642_cov96-Cyclotella_meneghiniana.AAC.3